MGTNNGGGTFIGLMVPKALKYPRILVLVELTRFLGLNLFSGIQSGTLTADTALYAIGDALVAATSIPARYGLRQPGVKRYGLVIRWVAFGE